MYFIIVYKFEVFKIYIELGIDGNCSRAHQSSCKHSRKTNRSNTIPSLAHLNSIYRSLNLFSLSVWIEKSLEFPSESFSIIFIFFSEVGEGIDWLFQRLWKQQLHFNGEIYQDENFLLKSWLSTQTFFCWFDSSDDFEIISCIFLLSSPFFLFWILIQAFDRDKSFQYHYKSCLLEVHPS